MSQLALLIPGGRGQLGSDVAARARGFVHAPGSAELDITEPASVTDAVASLAARARKTGLHPVVVNTAAYTAVDAAETHEDRAYAVNAQGPRLLAAACADQDVALVHVSTDYVFPGDGVRPYEPDDPTGPHSAYGRTKLAGEQAVLASGARAWIVRTAWVYGANGGNFVRTMARLERARETVSVVDDQRGSPTWSADLANGLLELARQVVGERPPAQRVLHCAGGGEASWFQVARAVFAELGADPARVLPCSTAEYALPAPRPAYSVLSAQAWRVSGLTPLRPWRDALAAAFTECGDALRGTTSS